MLVAAGLAAPAGASAAPASTFTVPVSLTTFTPCPEDGGEPVHFDGFMRITSVFTTDAAGGFHEIATASSHLMGTGLESGDRYVSNNTDLIVGNYPAGGRSVVVNVSHYRTDHTGPAGPDDDFSLRLIITPGGYVVDDEGCA